MPIIFPRFPKVVLTGDADAGNVMAGKTFYKDDPKQKLTGVYVPAAPPVLDGDAGAGEVLAGKTFYKDDAYTKLTGSLALSGDAVAGNVLAGKTFYKDDAKTKLTGTIPIKAAATITPGTTNQTIAAGQYLSGAQTIAGDANLIAGNIKNGVNIFGVNGSLPTGKKYASGEVAVDLLESKSFTTPSGVSSSFSPATVSGLTFLPSLIVVILYNASNPTERYETNYSAYSFPIKIGSIKYTTEGKIAMFGSTEENVRIYSLTGNAYVNSTGFCLPMLTFGTASWYAWE